MYIFTKFHKDWTKIVDFLLIAKFLASPDNYATPSKYAQNAEQILLCGDAIHFVSARS